MPNTDRLIAGPAGPGPLELRDQANGHVLQRFALGRLWNTTLSSYIEPAFTSPDGRFLYLLWSAVNPDGSSGAAYVQRWSIARGGRPTVLPMHETGIVAATATADNRLVAATNGAITTWNATTLRKISTVRGPRLPGFANGAISPDGRTFGYGLADGTVHFVDITTGHSRRRHGAHAADVQAVAFSPDSRTAVSTGDDGVAIVWNPRTGVPLQRLVGHAGRVIAANFSPDGHTLYTASLDGTVLQWDMAGSRRFGSPFTAGSNALASGNGSPSLTPLPPAAISPDGSTLAVRSQPHTVGLFSTATLARTGSIRLHGGDNVVSALAWAGSRVVVGSTSGAVAVWSDSGTPARLGSLSGLSGTVRGDRHRRPRP